MSLPAYAFRYVEHMNAHMFLVRGHLIDRMCVGPFNPIDDFV